MTFVLSFRESDRDQGGPVLGGQLQRWTAHGARADQMLVAELAAESQVTFLLHGFNVSLTEGRQSLRRLAQLLEARVDGALVATLWPGDSRLGALSYSFEGDDADDTAEALKRFVSDNLSSGTRLSFVAHSLGARVALGAMQGLADHGFEIDQVCLMGAAVDDDCLANEAEYRHTIRRAKRVGVLHSKADRVLRLAYPAGDLLQAFLFFWRDSPGLALGFHGPRGHERNVPQNVMDVALGDREVRHGDYLPPACGQLNAKQSRAAGYVAGLVAGEAHPQYEPIP